jgi:hypothetical protein
MLANRLQLEVLETELLMLPRLAGALANAMQAGHPDFDLDALAMVAGQAKDNVLFGLPYIGGPGGPKSAVARERAELIRRARERRDRLVQNRNSVLPEKKPAITPIRVGKKNVTRGSRPN